MRREDLVDLNAFVTVAEERSFTRAAAKLGTSQSALSHKVRKLEERLGVRLLARTTRSVLPTNAGERLLKGLRPVFDDIDAELSALTELRTKPAGNIRITAADFAARSILWPAIKKLAREYPDIHVEVNRDAGLTDIIAQRFDAGVRLGEQVAKDMIAVRIGPELRMAAVAAPSYFANHGTPKTLQDLAHHQCINLRMTTSGGFYAWEFEENGRELRVRVEGQLAFNDSELILEAARTGFGIAFIPDDHVEKDLASGKLVRVLDNYCPPFPGYHLYYPSRRQNSPAFSLLVEALRYRG